MPLPLLEVPMIRQRALPITVELYHALGMSGLVPEKTELLEGVIVEKISKSPLHSSLLQRVARKLREAAEKHLEIRQEQPITCKDSEPEPDLALVPAQSDDYEEGHPKTAELVVEISVSSSEIDRRKAAIYAAAGVREYWIVLSETRQIEVHTKLTDRKYGVQRIFSEGQTAFSEILPVFRVSLAELFRC